MNFLVDMPLSPALARWLREEGHDAVHASEIGMAEASDAEILSRAKRESRILVTADLDYSRLLALARATEPGLILFRSGNWNDRQIRTSIQELLRTLSATDIEQSILVVERDRVRRRRLPLRDS